MSGKDFKSAFKIAGVYTGLILGAGFASGRELMSFFACYGNAGFLGLAVSGLIFAFCGWAVLDICFTEKIDSYEKFSKRIFGGFAGKVVEYGVAGFLLVLFATMLAAGGAAFKEALLLPPVYGVVLLGIFCFIVFNIGVSAFVEINAVLAPIMVAGGIFIGLYSLFLQSAPVFNIIPETSGRYYWLLQAVVYACYNIVTAISVLATMGNYAVSRKAAKYGGIAGGLSLALLGAALSIPLIFNFNMTGDMEIPMLYIVNNYGSIIKSLYLFVLLSAIVTTAVGNGYAFIMWLSGKIKVKPVYINIFTVGLAMCLSSVGFSSFVSKIYPAFSAVGIVQLLFILIYILKRKNKR